MNGQHPQTVAQLTTWLEDTVADWNANPTPFVWGGNERSAACAPNAAISVAAAFL